MSNSIKLNYRNWKGIRSKRRVIPIKLEYKSTEYHPEIQWILIGFDIGKQDIRSFAIKDIHFPIYVHTCWKAKTPLLDKTWDYELHLLLGWLKGIIDVRNLQLKESISIFKSKNK